MTIVSRVLCRRADLGAGHGIDPLVLTSEERSRPHFVAETASGRRVRLSLDRGCELQEGDVLLVDGDWAVIVEPAEEDLLFLSPGDDPIIWWAACYQLGNLHRPARFLGDGVLTPADAMAEHMLTGLGANVKRVRRPFVGRRFGAAQGHHHHTDPVAQGHGA